MTPPAVVDGPGEITPEWLSCALEVPVAAVEAERIGTGQMGTTYRLALGYDGDGGPPSLVAKLAGENPAMRELVAPGYAAEVGFYRELAPELDVRVPRCWYGAIAGQDDVLEAGNLIGQRSRCCGKGIIDDQNLRRGIVEHINQLRHGQPGVEGHNDAAGPGHRKKALQITVAVQGQNCQPVSRV